MRRYLERERLSFLARLRVAAGRIGESEDDELACRGSVPLPDPSAQPKTRTVGSAGTGRSASSHLLAQARTASLAALAAT